jgi:hypothetical protein
VPWARREAVAVIRGRGTMRDERWDDEGWWEMREMRDER